MEMMIQSYFSQTIVNIRWGFDMDNMVFYDKHARHYSDGDGTILFFGRTRSL